MELSELRERAREAITIQATIAVEPVLQSDLARSCADDVRQDMCMDEAQSSEVVRLPKYLTVVRKLSLPAIDAFPLKGARTTIGRDCLDTCPRQRCWGCSPVSQCSNSPFRRVGYDLPLSSTCLSGGAS